MGRQIRSDEPVGNHAELLLRQTRDALGLTRWEHLADLLEIPHRTLFRWRAGQLPPAYGRILELACAELVRRELAKRGPS